MPELNDTHFFPATPAHQFEHDGRTYQVDEKLTGFDIYNKPSSTVEFFGIGPENAFFIQFKSGAYAFKEVPTETLEASVTCESIGKFFHANIKGKFETHNYAGKLITERVVANV